ncbi:MAG TPA: isoaspartyl peptidase/L-asparaginase [Steroidobacteraceae bacterium]|jgi:isoaspartyl peptidase/L-asparaginase-like protein (Ntn-hydrolase superfamily)|nr:isoaspartyl peptidase/L-asparaginase [Steroidobacteraceae bacterium]
MYALAIHGGAGTLGAAGRDPAHQAALCAALTAALQTGERVLQADGAALDAVEAAVLALEDDALFNAGHGAVLAADGSVELDAAIMEGTTLRAGAVALVRRTRNPVRLARCVLDALPHVFLAGEAADRFAAQCGLPAVANDYFVTDARRAQLRSRGGTGTAGADTVGTVGAVARDRRGHLAAATSTGGTVGKRPGRIGDSPVIGAGTYADDAACAVSTTGQGEWLLRTVQAYDLVARLRYARQPLEVAMERSLARLSSLQARGGMIAVAADGTICMRHNTETMLRAAVRAGEAPSVAIF